MKKSPVITWTTPYHGVSHAVGIPKRWQITRIEFGTRPGRGEAYLADLEGDTPFSRAKEVVGSMAHVKRVSSRWARELAGNQS